jgi:hypothetical protein
LSEAAEEFHLAPEGYAAFYTRMGQAYMRGVASWCGYWQMEWPGRNGMGRRMMHGLNDQSLPRVLRVYKHLSGTRLASYPELSNE